MLRFTVEGQPVPKARARSGKGGRHYTPERTRAYERAIGLAALQARQRVDGVWPRDRLYSVLVDVTPKDRRSFDGSNVLKSVEDAMNGIVYDDDRQVKDTRCRVSAPDAARPRVEITVEVLDAT